MQAKLLFKLLKNGSVVFFLSRINKFRGAPNSLGPLWAASAMPLDPSVPYFIEGEAWNSMFHFLYQQGPKCSTYNCLLLCLGSQCSSFSTVGRFGTDCS